jgi:hypothetical protein
MLNHCQIVHRCCACDKLYKCEVYDWECIQSNNNDEDMCPECVDAIEADLREWDEQLWSTYEFED